MTTPDHLTTTGAAPGRPANDELEAARRKRDEDAREAPPRGTPAAARWIATKLGWWLLDVALESVDVDGYEPSSGVMLRLSNGRGIHLTVADLYTSTKFQAAIGAGLHYGAPRLKQDLLNEIAGAILGLATVDEAFSSLEEAADWGLAYLASAARVLYDDKNRDGGARVQAAWDRWEALDQMRRGWVAREMPPPNEMLERTSDGALLVVRSWFHYEVRNHLGGDRGITVQRIASLMRQVGWRRPAAKHWKVATGHPETRKVASVNAYVVPADWEDRTLGEGLDR